MTFIPVPNCASIEMIFDANGQKVENVFHASKINSWTESDLADVAAAFYDWENTYGKTARPPQVSLSLIVAKDMESDSGPAIEYTTGLPVVGTWATGYCQPLNVTVAVKFGTALRGRSYRGRIYHIGVTEFNLGGNQITSAFQALLLANYAALVSAVGTAGYDLCVASKFHAKAPRSVGISTPITSVSVDINVDSQRRRLTGRGQ